MTDGRPGQLQQDRLGRGLVACLWALSLFGLSTFARTTLGRAWFPWPLEWMEGASAQHALRLLHGLPLYAAPAADFVPYLYPPLGYVPMALGLWILGPSLPAARAASLACSAGALLLLGRAGARAGGSALAGFVAAGLFALGFGYAGAFLDLARVDACFMLLVLAGVERVLAGRPRAALGWLALSAFTKQHGLLFLLALSCALLLQAPRTYARAVFAAWACVLGAFGALELTSGGWFWRYTMALPAGQPLSWPLLGSFFAVDVLLYLPVLALGALFDLRARWDARALRVFDALLLAGLCAGALGRAHAGGHDNVRLPAFALLCIAGSAPLCRVLAASERPRPARVRAAAVAALVLQFVMLWQPPALHAPDAASAPRFRALHAALDHCAQGGSRAALDYAFIDQPFVHTMALSDLRLGANRALAAEASAALVSALAAPSAPRALAVGEHFPALDRALMRHYRECARLPAPTLATGYRPGRGRSARWQIVYALAPASR